MSSHFHHPNNGSIYARWDKLGGFDLVGAVGIPAEAIHAFIEWLEEGPPKKRYRITRTFDERPSFAIAVEDATHSRLGNESWTPLTDADIEEVWE